MEEEKTYEETEEQWKKVKSWNELLEMQGMYLEGKLQFSPTYNGKLNEESQQINSELKKITQSRQWVTTWSQPGVSTDEYNVHLARNQTEQRAFLCGFVKEDSLEIVKTLASQNNNNNNTSTTDFHVCIWAVKQYPYQCLVHSNSKDCSCIVTRIKRDDSPKEDDNKEWKVHLVIQGDKFIGRLLDGFARSLPSVLVQYIKEHCFYIQIIDNTFGRSQHLWNTLCF